jgi:tetratricopeptide (TPR) repeat protein
VLVDLGSAFDLKGDDRQAQSYLEQALALEPENRAVKATLASVHHARLHRLMGGGQAERAAAEGERAVDLDPATAEHYECLGEPYLKLGRLDAARAVFERALALAPRRPETRVAIGRAYLAHGFEQEAEKLFGQALRVGRGALTRLAIGLSYLQVGKVERAHQHFQPVLKTRQPFLHATIGKLLIEAEHEVEAIPFLERAVAQAPLDSRARLDLAWAYTFGSGDYARAAGELAEAERAAQALGELADLAEIDTARRTLEALRLEAALGRRGARSREQAWR